MAGYNKKSLTVVFSLLSLLLIGAIVFVIVSQQKGAKFFGSDAGDKETGMKLTSSAFSNNDDIPVKYTCDGDNISPPLRFGTVPEETQSFAIIVDDPDSPTGTFVHWVIYNIPADVEEVNESVPVTESLSNGSLQGVNDFNKIGYGGPCPGSGKHRYFFKLYALDTMLELPSRATKKELEQAMEGHIIVKSELVGLYERQ